MQKQKRYVLTRFYDFRLKQVLIFLSRLATHQVG